MPKKAVKAKTKLKRETHRIKVRMQAGKLVCIPPRVVVPRGDTIVWKLDVKKKMPYAVVVKAVESPLTWSARSVPLDNRKGLSGRVRRDAVPGFYPYAFCACGGKTIVIEDPDIIVPPPKGGRG